MTKTVCVDALSAEEQGLFSLPDNKGRAHEKKGSIDFLLWYTDLALKKSNYSHHSRNVLHITEMMEGKAICFADISPNWIRIYRDYLVEKVSNNTARQYMIALYVAMDQAVAEDILVKNIFVYLDKRKDYLKLQDVTRKDYSLEELERLANTHCEIDPQIKQGYLFSCFTGMRWSDLNCLKWSQITVKQIQHEELYYLSFLQEKTTRSEYVPLSAQAIEIIKSRILERTDEKEPFVFPFLKEKNSKSQTTYNFTLKALKKWASKAGFDPKMMSWHTARHSFATNILEHTDVDLLTLAKLLGHRSLRSVQIYAHIRDRMKIKAVKALPQLKIESPLKGKDRK